MRIALVHSYYASGTPSGENFVVDAQAEALRAAGHEVLIVAKHTDIEQTGRLYGLRAAARVATGVGPSPRDELESFAPDVVHVHNLFPNWGRSWLAEWRGPLVATIHNFRPMCAAGTLFRDGAGCTQCPDHGSWNAVRHACYRNAAASVPLAIATRRGAAGDALLRRADRVILLSERVKAIYLAKGVAEERLELVPNFVSRAGFDPTAAPGGHWLYIGRLTDEKGVVDLLSHWPHHREIRVFGSGPRQDAVEALAAARSEIVYGGIVPRDSVPNLLAASRGLAVPSKWAEGAIPLSYVEALAAGRPTISVPGNGAADDIARHGTGAVADGMAGIPAAVNRIESEWETVAGRARARFEEAFDLPAWLAATERVYRTAVDERAGATR
jgi:glycosyltransferase involved in cell wall biosynthesis